MGIGLGDPISVVNSVDVWVDFLMLDTGGAPLPSLDLATINIWYSKHNANSLVSKTLTPGTNLVEVGDGYYRVLLTAAEVDTVGLFFLVVEAATAAQTFDLLYILAEEGVEGGIPQNSEAWLPYRAITGFAATGVTGLASVSNLRYKKFGANVQVVKTPTFPADIRDLGRGIYSLRFLSTELDVEGAFLYTVVQTPHDTFNVALNVALGGSNSFVFTVEIDGQPASGHYIDVRRASDLSLLGSVQTGVTGKATALLPQGDFIATLRNGTRVYDENNTPIFVSDQSSLNKKTLDGAGLTATTPGSLPNVSTGTATLQNPAQVPIKGQTIRVTMRKPQLEGGILYLGYEDLVTDENGQVSKDFTEGLLITVVVEGTNIVREFEVPTSDFNLLSSALSVADPFTITTPTFPVAPTHV
jgi:hypothetical protein